MPGLQSVVGASSFRGGFGLFEDPEIRSGHWRLMLQSFINDNVQSVEFPGLASGS